MSMPAAIYLIFLIRRMLYFIATPANALLSQALIVIIIP